VIVGAGDLREPDALEPLLVAACERFGRVDLAVLSAGIWPPEHRLLHEMDPARILEVIDVDLVGTILSARSFVRMLAHVGPRADGRGASVCLIGSTAGRFGEAGHVEYAVSKAGLVGLVRSLKNEIVHVDPRARVNMVEPGWVVTPMAEPELARAGVVERVLATMPLRQLAKPDDIASAVLFFSSPTLARHVSGEILTVAGGMEGRRLWTDDDIDPKTV
jgi:3-oxoacyl-[acyl-carrier protein] reductase